MSTTNLKLEKINLNDTINGTMLQKMNNNMQKIDDKYGEFKKTLLEQTGKATLEEVIAYIQNLASQVEHFNSTGDATASQILSGKKAVVKGQVVVGTMPSQGAQTIMPSTSNQTIDSGRYLSGTQTISGDANLLAENIVAGKSIFGVVGSYTEKKQTTINISGETALTGYGAGIDHNGTLVIWAMSDSTAFEHISFKASNIIGTKGVGWDITAFDTSDPTQVPYACTITGLSEYSIINIQLSITSSDTSRDYYQVSVTITGS